MILTQSRQNPDNSSASKRILVLESNDSFYDCLSDLLKRKGFAVERVAHSDTLVQELDEHSYDGIYCSLSRVEAASDLPARISQAAGRTPVFFTLEEDLRWPWPAPRQKTMIRRAPFRFNEMFRHFSNSDREHAKQIS